MPTVSYEDFKEAWIEDVLSGNPTNVEKGRRFAEKIIKDWRGFPDSTEITYCDGTGDGGIDVAILDRPDEDEGETSGDTWYLIQSKYGTAWRGNTTAVEEALKLFDTLEGEGRVQQSLITEEIVEKVRNFLRQAGEDDRLVLVFATVNPPTPGEKKRLNDIRDFGKSRFDVSFDVVSISVRTIYERLQDEIARDVTERLTIPIKGHLTYGGLDLLIGVVSLLDLYRFLKVYRERTQDLDQLYERNVRRYLGGVKVNKAIQSTLRESPEKFGLYNNGITIVVSDFQANGDEYNLIEPYIVNGCQTC